jgi:histidinol-phosphate aminotransferase
MIGAVFFPGALGQAAALRALEPDVTEELRRRCTALVESRTRLTAELRGLGLTVAPSQANFLWLPLGERAAPFAESARETGILVRAVDGQGVRITVGSAEANDRFRAFVRATSPP